VSAARRSEAAILMDMVGRSTGHRVVQYQGSSADVRNGRTVTRTWHWAKDLQVSPKSVTRRERDLLAMVDVDYYIDMPDYLATYVQPTILYTFQPSAVAKCTGEYKYTFAKDNVVEYRVAGGGNYRHKVWNYDGDSASTMSWFCGCIPQSYVAYNIERRRIDEDHQVVLLTPLARWNWIWAWYAHRHLGMQPLTRLKITHGDFLRMQTNTAQGMMVHTGLIGQYISSSVPWSADSAIACAKDTSSTKLTLAAVKTKLDIYGGDVLGAEVLHKYHREMDGALRPDVVSNTAEGVRSFQWTDRIAELDLEVKPAMIAFMDPIIHGAFVPTDCINNDKRLITTRVNNVRDNTVMTDNVRRRADEFINQLKKMGVHELRLCDIDEVYDRQAKPTQQAILHRADHEQGVDATNSFMKKEAYPSVNDPRNISQLCGPVKRDYSRVCYPLTDAIKNMNWYSFGRTPAGVAARVGAICRRANFVLVTDFSRMDGRISPAVRYFERLLLTSVFHRDDVNFVIDTWKQQYGLRGRTKFGVAYETGTSRLSGSPETSIFNTILTAFIMFLAYRGTKCGGKYYTVEESFANIGICGGDDGLTADVLPSLLSRKARDMGQVLTCQRVDRGHLGVTFLSRFYSPDVWNCETLEDLSTVCDVKRAMSKFHVTVRLAGRITAAQKLYDKSYALYLSDANTPIIGPFVKKVLELFPRHKFLNCVGIWSVHPDLDGTLQYPNKEVEWAWEIVHRDIPSFDVDKFNEWLGSASTTTIFHPPKFAEIAETRPKEGIVMVDDDVVVNQATVSQESLPGEPKIDPVRARKRSRRKSTPRDEIPCRPNRSLQGGGQSAMTA
jgi:hypothetical protein